jgi:S1-C subfamily serine protease
VLTIYINQQSDLAILKIDDDRFQPVKTLPYSILKQTPDLGEEIFTLGYPRPSSEIVYNRGYLSANTGYNGDTLAYQIAISANPGNSGGPIFNQDGEVIGVLSGRQITAEGVIFSSRSKNIFTALQDIRKDTATDERIKLPAFSSSVKSLSRTQQIKRIEDCVYMVKSY